MLLGITVPQYVTFFIKLFCCFDRGIQTIYGYISSSVQYIWTHFHDQFLDWFIGLTVDCWKWTRNGSRNVAVFCISQIFKKYAIFSRFVWKEHLKVTTKWGIEVSQSFINNCVRFMSVIFPGVIFKVFDKPEIFKEILT